MWKTSTTPLIGVASDLLAGLADLAWPNLCLLCERPLIQGEQHICLNCLYALPSIQHVSFFENQTGERFMGKIQYVRAAAGFRYTKGSSIQKALELLKYKGEKEVGSCLARVAASRLYEEGFFKDIDLLIPVPLHRKKQKKRGYNQSEWIAMGLSQLTRIPLETKLLGRTTDNASQTTRNLWSRWENAQGLFQLNSSQDFTGKHFLLVDDVLTSGSTLEACAKALLTIPEVKVSIFALALA